MERPIFKIVGTPADELDTPALTIDIDILDRNIDVVHSYFSDKSVKLRPNVEIHRCPDIAKRQVRAGGTVGGIEVGSVAEAEVFRGHGFDDIFISTQTVTPIKIGKLCSLAREVKITVPVDGLVNAEQLAAASTKNGTDISVLVDVDAGGIGTGLEAGKPALDLALQILNLKGINFEGFRAKINQTYCFRGEDRDSVRAHVQKVLDTREMAETKGIPIHVVSLSGTSHYDTIGQMPGVTEIVAGSYSLMSEKLRHCRPELQPAAQVLSVVMSNPEPGFAYLDCGQKSISTDRGLPVVEDPSGLTLTKMSAEHGHVELDRNVMNETYLGQKVRLTPWDIGDTMNLYDYVNVIQDGILVAIWPVTARGCY